MKIATPVILLQDNVAFPGVTIKIIANSKRTVSGLLTSAKHDDQVLIVLQKNVESEQITEEDLYFVGTVAKILNVYEAHSGNKTFEAKGLKRVVIDNYDIEEDFIVAEYQDIQVNKDGVIDMQVEMTMRQTVSLAKRLDQLNAVNFENNEEEGDAKPTIDRRVYYAENLKSGSLYDLDALCDHIASVSTLALKHKHVVLETFAPIDRLYKLKELLEYEIHQKEIQRQLARKVKIQKQISQREYYLNEQMKAIRKELGGPADIKDEVAFFLDAVENANLPIQALNKAQEDIHRFQFMTPSSSEAHVVRNYIEWLLATPWEKSELQIVDPLLFRTSIEHRHFGSDNVVDWVVEQISLIKLGSRNVQPICLVGPPGVGKTSIVKTIAESMELPVAVVSLGGVHDVNYLRGLSRFYTGAEPGKIIKALREHETTNLVVLLDEVDKLDNGHRGHPGAVLCEMLDGSASKTFTDSYLAVPIDISNIIFIATANNREDIYPPLLSRLKVLEMWGYEEEEKFEIAKKHLLPKIVNAHHLDRVLSINDDALREIVTRYTNEPGVRDLENILTSICRKVAVHVAASEHVDAIDISKERISILLGAPYFAPSGKTISDQVGQVLVAHLQGKIIKIDCAIVPGNGAIRLVGVEDNVLLDTASIAHGAVRGFINDMAVWRKSDILISIDDWVADGQNDGGMALGVAIAIISAVRLKGVPNNLVVIGKVDVLGKVHGVSGIFPRIAAARRHDAKNIILPLEHKRAGDDLQFPQRLVDEIDISYVESLEEAVNSVW